MSTASIAATQILQLTYIDAAQAIEIIEPHLEEHTKITGKGNQLFIKASDSDLALIKSLLAELDVTQDEFLVELKILNRKLDQWEMRPNQANNDPFAKGSNHYTTNNNDHNLQLRLMANTQGFIKTAETFPKTQINQQYDAFLPKTIQGSVSSGFLVTLSQAIEPPANNSAQSIDNHPSRSVNISIIAHTQQKAGIEQQRSNQQSTRSQFTARLGDWTLIAATQQEESNNSTRYTTNNTQNTNKRWFYLRVRAITN